MTAFKTRIFTRQTDRVFVEIDRRFEVVIVSHDSGIDLHVYPITFGHLWDCPFQSFTVTEDEIYTPQGGVGEQP